MIQIDNQTVLCEVTTLPNGEKAYHIMWRINDNKDGKPKFHHIKGIKNVDKFIDALNEAIELANATVED